MVAVPVGNHKSGHCVGSLWDSGGSVADKTLFAPVTGFIGKIVICL